MKFNLPGCDFKRCRFYTDGNCSNRTKYNNCDYQYLKKKDVDSEKPNKINAVDSNTHVDLLNTLDKLYRHISDAIMFGRYSTDKDKETLKEYATALMSARAILLNNKEE